MFFYLKSGFQVKIPNCLILCTEWHLEDKIVWKTKKPYTLYSLCNPNILCQILEKLCNEVYTLILWQKFFSGCSMQVKGKIMYFWTLSSIYGQKLGNVPKSEVSTLDLQRQCCNFFPSVQHQSPVYATAHKLVMPKLNFCGWRETLVSRAEFVLLPQAHAPRLSLSISLACWEASPSLFLLFNVDGRSTAFQVPDSNTSASSSPKPSSQSSPSLPLGSFWPVPWKIYASPKWDNHK